MLILFSSVSSGSVLKASGSVSGSHMQELDRMRGICSGLQEDLELCKRSLEEKSRQEEMAQKELIRLRAEVEKRQLRSDSKELFRLKEAMSLLEQGDLEKSRRLLAENLERSSWSLL